MGKNQEKRAGMRSHRKERFHLKWKLSGGWVVPLLFAAALLFFGRTALAGEAGQEEIRIQEQDQAQSGGRTMRVAFPQVKGVSETDGNGDRRGMMVDYLNEIAKYTGWRYEYIDTDGESMTQEFLDGKYDLMGGTYYMPELEEYFAYPDYNEGTTKAILLARREDERLKSYDWSSMSGMTIGVYDRAHENIRRLKVFLESNAIDCKIKYYTYEQMSDGNLYTFLENGEVDMLLGNYGDDTVRFRAVAEFSSQPIYIVTASGNREVVDAINMAMQKILESDPDFAEKCYEANYPDSVLASIFLNVKEKEYIQQKKSVSVAVVRQWHPLFCLEEQDNLHDGMIPDMLQKVREFSGLEFTYVYADSYAEALEMVRQKKADMLGAFLGSEEEGSRKGLALTSSYASLNDIIVRNKSVPFPSENLAGATLKGREIPGRMNAGEVKEYLHLSDAVQAVNRGEADYFYGLSTSIEHELQGQRYMNVVPNTLSDSAVSVCFAVKSPVDTELFTIMNKAVSGLGRGDKTALVNRNIVSMGIGALTLVEMVYAKPVMFISVLACIFFLVVILLLVIFRSRVRAVRMQGSLDRAESASQAKGEFLSRMSHEIRTPMNAIVGLSNLTCMMEGVPDGVRENLYKIQSSSRYLLRLINDILDMSRIESGKMTMAAEPFSLKQLMEELQGMLAADAQQRGLKFLIEAQIEDDALIGDAIRIKQVLTNLISNAFKFTPAGGRILVSVKKTGGTQEIAEYTFQVSDSGVGISQENQKRIFESFEQVGPSYSKSQGTGLGLAISKNIVRLMGGELRLKSETGIGSEFHFTVSFPIGVLREEPEREEGAGLEKLNILLAEDNDLNAEIAQELLRMQGAAVRRAVDGREATALFANSSEGEYQAILMDIQMPVMDGLEACRAIRKMERSDAAKIPIIAMTANSFQEDVDAAKSAGMDDFIAKPVDVEHLYRVLFRMAARDFAGTDNPEK